MFVHRQRLSLKLPVLNMSHDDTLATESVHGNRNRPPDGVISAIPLHQFPYDFYQQGQWVAQNWHPILSHHPPLQPATQEDIIQVLKRLQSRRPLSPKALEAWQGFIHRHAQPVFTNNPSPLRPDFPIPAIPMISPTTTDRAWARDLLAQWDTFAQSTQQSSHKQYSLSTWSNFHNAITRVALGKPLRPFHSELLSMLEPLAQSFGYADHLWSFRTERSTRIVARHSLTHDEWLLTQWLADHPALFKQVCYNMTPKTVKTYHHALFRVVRHQSASRREQDVLRALFRHVCRVLEMPPDTAYATVVQRLIPISVLSISDSTISSSALSKEAPAVPDAAQWIADFESLTPYDHLSKYYHVVNTLSVLLSHGNRADIRQQWLLLWPVEDMIRTRLEAVNAFIGTSEDHLTV